MARVSRKLKNSDNSDLLRQSHARLTQCSKPVKNRQNPGFLNLNSSRFLSWIVLFCEIQNNINAITMCIELE